MKNVLFGIAGAFFLSTAAHAATLTTGFAGGNGFAGNMFDVKTGANAIDLTDIEVHLDNNSATTMSFWYRQGGYSGFEGSSTGWTLLDQASVIGQGAGSPSPWDIQDTSFSANTLYGFYIHANKSDLDYSDLFGAPTAVAAQNSDLTIYTGLGRGLNSSNPFATSSFNGRSWNGTLNYQVAAVPLPAGLPLLFVGLGGLAIFGRKKHKTA